LKGVGRVYQQTFIDTYAKKLLLDYLDVGSWNAIARSCKAILASGHCSAVASPIKPLSKARSTSGTAKKCQR
jgi:hypothetical protein